MLPSTLLVSTCTNTVISGGFCHFMYLVLFICKLKSETFNNKCKFKKPCKSKISLIILFINDILMRITYSVYPQRIKSKKKKSKPLVFLVNVSYFLCSNQNHSSPIRNAEF